MSADKMKIQLRNRETGEILNETEGTIATLHAWSAEAAKRNRIDGANLEARIAPEADETQRLVDGELVAKTREELVKDGVITQAEADEQAAQEVRSKRDGMLKESDYMVLPDAPVDAAKAKVYRQALRDITEQKGFPHKVEWPEL